MTMRKFTGFYDYTTLFHFTVNGESVYLIDAKGNISQDPSLVEELSQYDVGSFKLMCYRGTLKEVSVH